MPSRRRPAEPVPAEGRDRWRRRVLVVQGCYYLLTGIWPLVHFNSFADAVALAINPFQAQVFGAVIAVVGGSLIEAGRRGPPAAATTALGIAVAGAIAMVSLLWLPRQSATSALWIDLAIEIVFAVVLVLLYPKAQSPERSRAQTRRR
jgi:peptidoglycan/LPS O-acetylase OafA/YrhL